MATRALEMDLFRRELLKGSTETLILSLLADEPMYGYQLLREMDKRSSGYFRLKEGTLYPALHRLARVGLVRSEWTKSPNGQLRRYYHLTQVGYEKLRSMLREWDLFTKAVSLVSGSVGSLARSVLKPDDRVMASLTVPPPPFIIHGVSLSIARAL